MPGTNSRVPSCPGIVTLQTLLSLAALGRIERGGMAVAGRLSIFRWTLGSSVANFVAARDFVETSLVGSDYA